MKEMYPLISLMRDLNGKGLSELSKDFHVIGQEKIFNDHEFFFIYNSIFEVVSKESFFMDMFIDGRWYYGVRRINGFWYHVFKKIGEKDSNIKITIDK